MPLPVENVISGKYEILEKIREGGMGAIYKVRHRLLDEIRIIKVLRSELAMEEKLRMRFQNEAKFAIQLRHPNIAHLYDFSVSADGTSAYIVMEYIDGVTLQEFLAGNGAPSVGLAVEIATQGLRALQCLHTQGFVHRDVAADNLMLSRDFQGDPLVKLIDLGIAKGQGKSLNLTATGVFMGKVRYSAPELFKTEGGAADLDERSDIYSFGILLYELLTGQSPVNGDSFSEIVAGHLFRPPLSFDESDPDRAVPEGLRALTLDALEKDPDKRVSSADEFLGRLAQFAAPSEAYEDEYTRLIAATTQLATLRPKTSAAGSTQDRLDRQFGVNDPSSPPSEIEERRAEAVSEAASAIRDRSSSGDTAGAAEDLRLAISLYGDHAEFERLQSELPAAPPDADRDAAVESPGSVAPAGRPVKLDPIRWLTSPVGISLLVGLVLSTGGLWLARVMSQPARPVESPMAISVEPAPRWQPPVERARPLLPEPETAEPERESKLKNDSTSARRRPSRPAAPPETVDTPVVSAAPEVKEAPPATTAVRRGELFGPDPGVTPPSLLQVPAPVYPPKFDPPRRELDVMVDVLVSEDGKVITAKAAPRESAKRRFKELAVDTAKGATFRPATKHGVAGKMWTVVRVTLPPR